MLYTPPHQWFSNVSILKNHLELKHRSLGLTLRKIWFSAWAWELKFLTSSQMRLIWLVEKLALNSSVQLNLFFYLPSLPSLNSSPSGSHTLNYARLAPASGPLNMLSRCPYWDLFYLFLMTSSQFPYFSPVVCDLMKQLIKASRDEHVPQDKPVENTIQTIGVWIVSRMMKMAGVVLPEEAMAPHSSTLAWRVPWTEEPGRLQSMGSLRVRHDWATSLSLFTLMHWRRKWQPTPVFLPGESQGRGSLVGCRLWGRTESDTTEAT